MPSSPERKALARMQTGTLLERRPLLETAATLPAVTEERSARRKFADNKSRTTSLESRLEGGDVPQQLSYDNLTEPASASTSPKTDSRQALVERLLEAADFADARIDRENLAKGQKKLLEILAGNVHMADIDEDLPNILLYKGRSLMKATVLHLAIWCSAQLHEASLVNLVLECPYTSEELTKAKYELPSRQVGWKCELHLDALHIACGLGCLQAVDALVRHHGKCPMMSPASSCVRMVQEYVNICTVKMSYQVENPRNKKLENFYRPIHEAADKGFVTVTAYLLERGADGGAANLDGVLPLHLVAMRGSAGGIDTGAHDNLRRVVHRLQEAGGSLEIPVSRNHFNKKMANKTPLQLAACDDSRFPRNMMGLLVPCLQDNSISEPRFFADIAFLTHLDAEAASDVVREIRARSTKNNILQRFRLDAQMPGRTDLIAGILFLAPEAGAAMLDLLVGHPQVQDVAKHNIPTRTSLYGFWSHLPMRCIYKDDAVRRENVLMPVWNFEADKPLEEQKQLKWHRDLLPETHGHGVRIDHVYNVRVSTVLLPNILDLDVFVALSRAWRSQMNVFKKISVQGMIYCLWNNLIDRVWVSDMLFGLLELTAFMWWSMAWKIVGAGLDSPAVNYKPVCWAIIAAGALREIVQLGFVVVGCLSKYRSHTDETMRSMWHPCSSLFLNWVLPKLLIVLVQTRFAWGSHGHNNYDQLNGEDQVILATTVLVKAAQVTFMFRLCAGGKKIYAIFYSFLGGATREMISITAMIFGSFSLAFLVLAEEKSAGWVLASSYRGLLFGDGDGFNNLGMDVDEDSYPQNNEMLMPFFVLGSFFFNIIVLNLIIAVYSNEYDKVAGETPVLFLHGRAKCCVMYILSCQAFPWLGYRFNYGLKVAAGLLASLCVGLYWAGHAGNCELLVACLLAAAQVLFQAAQAQCDWFSIEGEAANGKEHFLWICHRDNDELQEASDSLQVGHLEQRLELVKKHVDDRIDSLEEKIQEKLDTILSQMSGNF